MNLNQLELTLLAEYRALAPDPAPHWAYNFPPSIPLVGKHFGDPLPRVLVYGSAENLTYTQNQSGADIHKLGENNWHRHRHFFEEGRDRDDFFPLAHIQPIQNGTLLTAARRVLEQLNHNGFATEPRAFVEQISVANFGKYSVTNSGKYSRRATSRNWDYAGKVRYLEPSLELVQADLRVLKPEVILVAGVTYEVLDGPRRRFWENTLDGRRPGSVTIVPIYQVQSLAMSTVRRRLRALGSLTPQHGPRNGWLERWLSEVDDVHKAWLPYYIRWLDALFEKGDRWRVRKLP